MEKESENIMLSGFIWYIGVTTTTALLLAGLDAAGYKTQGDIKAILSSMFGFVAVMLRIGRRIQAQVMSWSANDSANKTKYRAWYEKVIGEIVQFKRQVNSDTIALEKIRGNDAVSNLTREFNESVIHSVTNTRFQKNRHGGIYSGWRQSIRNAINRHEGKMQVTELIIPEHEEECKRIKNEFPGVYDYKVVKTDSPPDSNFTIVHYYINSKDHREGLHYTTEMYFGWGLEENGEWGNCWYTHNEELIDYLSKRVLVKIKFRD